MQCHARDANNVVVNGHAFVGHYRWYFYSSTPCAFSTQTPQIKQLSHCSSQFVADTIVCWRDSLSHSEKMKGNFLIIHPPQNNKHQNCNNPSPLKHIFSFNHFLVQNALAIFTILHAYRHNLYNLNQLIVKLVQWAVMSTLHHWHSKTGS